MANTLEMQMQLNKLLEDASKIVEKMTGQYITQSKVMEQLAESVKKINEAAKAAGGNSKLAESFKDASTAATEAKDDMTVAMEEAAKKINSTTESTKTMNKGFGDTSAALTKLNAGTAIIGGIGKAISFVAQSGLSALQMIQGIGGGIFEVAKSVLAFPFKMLDGLISMASVSGSNELATELEKIRQEFGYLNKTAGGTIISLAKSMKGELANTGISTWRTFGNLVERLQYFREYAQKLGETVDAVFRNLKASQAEALGAFNKGLGLTDAGLKAVGQRSIATGQDINEINRQIGNYAIQLSEAFGVTMKQVSKDVGEMMADFEHFGHLAVKELTQAAVFTRRLGIEVKSLGKLMDKYMNFEDAADSAAHLSQTFGMNVDAFKLMQEQDPAKKLEMLRKAFYATGRTVETMTAQERRLLAQQTGLGESEVALAFAQKNRALSYDDVRKKGDAAKKSQLTQEQVLNKLAGAIERLVKSGSAMQGGFFDRFIQGFVKGISMSKEFRELMRNLAASLNIVFRAGILVGRAFADLFPGVKQFFKGLADMFNPRIMKTFMTKVVGAFREFFDALTKNPTTALPVLLDKLQQAFTDRFNAAGPGAMKVMNGIKSFLKAVGYIFLTGIREALLGLGKVIAPLLNSIFSPESLSSAERGAGEAVGSLGNTLQEIFTNVFGKPGSPARAKVVESIDKFIDSVKNMLFAGLTAMVKKLPSILNLVASLFDNSGAGSRNSAQINNAAKSAGETFLDTLKTTIRDNSGTITKIAEGLTNLFIEGMVKIVDKAAGPLLMAALIGGLKRGLLFAGEAFTSVMVGLPMMLTTKVMEAIGMLFQYAADGFARLGTFLKQKLGSGLVGEVVEWITKVPAAFLAAIGGVAKIVGSIAAGVSTFVSDLFQGEGLLKSFETFKRIISNGLREAINGIVRVLPERVRSWLGISEVPIPPPPPAQNPGVVAIRQVEEASRTSGANIQENLNNALNVTPATPSVSSVSQNESIGERVSSMRSAIESARDVGRIDQAAAERSMQQLQAFAARIGPIMDQTQTALNNAFRNIDVGKMNETVDAIKSILGGVASIKQTVARNVGTLSVSEMMPLLNSISALTTFTTSPVMVRLAAQMSASENAARISGIQNTSNAIKDMVETINETSRELARISPINIQTNLQRLASNLGLGNNAAYTIRNENFTVQVNVDVHIDARELERTLVERPNTRIRHT